MNRGSESGQCSKRSAAWFLLEARILRSVGLPHHGNRSCDVWCETAVGDAYYRRVRRWKRSADAAMKPPARLAGSGTPTNSAPAGGMGDSGIDLPKFSSKI